MIQTFGRTCPKCTKYLVRKFPYVSAFHLAYAWSAYYQGLEGRQAEEVLVALDAVKKLSDGDCSLLRGIALFYSSRYEECVEVLTCDSSVLSKEYLGRALITIGLSLIHI